MARRERRLRFDIHDLFRKIRGKERYIFPEKGKHKRRNKSIQFFYMYGIALWRT